MQNNYMLYAIIASIIVGFHLFTLKMLSYKQNKTEKIFYGVITLITLLLSRYFIYKSMELTTNPTLVHIILNLSVFITFICSLFILKLHDFYISRFIIGIILITLGIGCIQSSYKIN